MKYCARKLSLMKCNRNRRHTKQLDSNATYLLVILVIASSLVASLEGLDLGSNVLQTLLVCEFWRLMFLGLGCPILCFLCRLEDGVFSDCGVGVSVDVLDVSRSNVIGEISRELLLEPECAC